MKKIARFFLKIKKGFTLVEIVVVLGLMAIAMAIAVPNLSGITTRAQMDTYRSYCLQAKEDMKTYYNLLNGGQTDYPITGANYQITVVDLTTPDGLMQAMNYTNAQSKFQYYIVGFSAGDAKTDPSAVLRKAKLEANKDVIVPVFYHDESKDTYQIYGVWFYSVGKDKVMLTMEKNNTDYSGFKALPIKDK